MRIIYKRIFPTEREAEKAVCGIKDMVSSPRVEPAGSGYGVVLYEHGDRAVIDRGYAHYRRLGLEVFVTGSGEGQS